MRIGVPKEIKVREYRVGLVPANVRELCARGHEVYVESGAGAGIAASDADYQAVGASIVPDADGVFSAAQMIVLEEVVHGLGGEAGVIDVRNVGLAAGIDLEPIPGNPGVRAMKVFERALDEGLLLRFTADTIALGPPFISTVDELQAMSDGLRRAIRHVMAQH